MCTYNGSEYLAEQVNSLLEQTYPNLEFIFVDDASQDDTFTILYELTLTDKRIRLYRNAVNLGYNKNFEKACSMAGGEYIAIADQDDVWETGKIKFMMENLWSEPATILTHGASAKFETGQPVDYRSARSRRVFRGNDVRRFFLYNHISGHNILFKKELLQWALPFPEGIYYDWWLAVVACCNGRIEATEKVLVYHRVHEKNSTGVHEKANYFYRDVLSRLPRFLAIGNLPAQARRFGEELLIKYAVLTHRSFSLPLFFFILKHAKIIFSIKPKRLFPWPTYIKYSLRLASAGYNRKSH
jgi:glycosyltransferase involved in cell wall biosynthesis